MDISRTSEFVAKTQLKVDGTAGFIEREVVRYGTGAAVICPKEFLGRKSYIVIMWERREDDVAGTRGPTRASVR